jgi:hypothetical protein
MIDSVHGTILPKMEFFIGCVRRGGFFRVLEPVVLHALLLATGRARVHCTPRLFEGVLHAPCSCGV